MLQSLDPTFLVAATDTIPIVWVAAILAPLAGAVSILHKNGRADIDRERADSRLAWEAVRDSQAVNAQLLALQKQQETALALQNAAMAQQQVALNKLLENQSASLTTGREALARVLSDVEEMKESHRLIRAHNERVWQVLNAKVG